MGQKRALDRCATLPRCCARSVQAASDAVWRQATQFLNSRHVCCPPPDHEPVLCTVTEHPRLCRASDDGCASFNGVQQAGGFPFRPPHEPQPSQMPPQFVDADDVISLDSFSFEDGVTGRGVELDDSGGGFAAADISLWGLSVSYCRLHCAEKRLECLMLRKMQSLGRRDGRSCAHV